MNKKPVAVVTGAYRGLGRETCRQLAHKGYTVVLTARDSKRGKMVIEELRHEGLDVVFHPLDVTQEKSVAVLKQYLETTFDSLDCLVNNAGVFPDPGFEGEASSVFNTDPERIRTGFETNALAPLLLCRALIPLMNGEGRVVNVSSGMGQLSEMNGHCPAYRLSKTALNAVTRIFADEMQGTGVKVNSVCPGWVRTDMGGEEAPLDVQQGAEGIVWAATLPGDGPSGGFFRHGETIPW